MSNMRRREILKKSGIGVSGIALGGVTLQSNQDRPSTVEIAVYYTTTAKEQIETNSPYSFTRINQVLSETIERIYSRTFDPEFTLNIVQDPVDVDVSGFSDVSDRRRHLLTWIDSPEPRRSQYSNILIEYDAEKTAGVATLGLIPASCCTLDRNGIVWFQSGSQLQGFIRLVAHEVGHTLGLGHNHGSLIGDSEGRTIMLNNNYAMKNSTNKYGEYIDASNISINIFNSKLSTDELVI